MKLVRYCAVIAASLSIWAQAENLEISKSNETLVSYIVSASKVKGVNMVLSKKVTADDCNLLFLETNVVNTSDNTDVAWNSWYFVTAGVSTTQMLCRRLKTETVVVSSKPIFFKSIENQNGDGEIYFSVLVPADFDVQFTEVAK